MKYDVFISYSNKDKVIATEICEYLEKNDIKCWMAPRNIVGGMAYAREILKGIDESQVLLFVFSANSNRSRHVESEINHAFNKEKIIIPFRTEDILMSDVLRYYMDTCHHIDGFPLSDETLERLKESIISNLPERCSKNVYSEVICILAHKYNLPIDDVKRILENAFEHEVLSESSEMNSFDELLDYFVKSESLPSEVRGKNFPLSNEVGVKGKYSIFQNKKGEIMLMMDARIGNPQKPRFIYDGKDVALLYRDENSSVALRHISESAHESLKNANEILVVEIFDDEVLREYIAPVRLVRDVNNLIIS